LTPGLLILILFLGVLQFWRPDAPPASPPSPATAEIKRPANSAPALGFLNSLHFDSGTATLTLEKIGTVTIEGPAEFKMLDPMRARLTRGCIKVRITEETGHGFVVETPGGSVKDLGTEFGVNVSEQGKVGLVVFDGAVDLQVDMPDRPEDFTRIERLVRGEGVTFDGRGELSRIMSIVTGKSATFQLRNGNYDSGLSPVIIDVSDNLPAADTKKFYQIVPGGLREDALAYVDRPAHQWNGMTKAGMPSYLRGADYVMTFNSERAQPDIKIGVTLSCPSKLFVFYFETSEPVPAWLAKNFHRTGDSIGLDMGPWPPRLTGSPYKNSVGPGKSMDRQLSIWERIVPEPGTVELGAIVPQSPGTLIYCMYGIAAIPLDKKTAAKEADATK
jgi:hypothetical protein